MLPGFQNRSAATAPNNVHRSQTLFSVSEKGALRYNLASEQLKHSGV